MKNFREFLLEKDYSERESLNEGLSNKERYYAINKIDYFIHDNINNLDNNTISKLLKLLNINLYLKGEIEVEESKGIKLEDVIINVEKFKTKLKKILNNEDKFNNVEKLLKSEGEFDKKYKIESLTSYENSVDKSKRDKFGFDIVDSNSHFIFLVFC